MNLDYTVFQHSIQQVYELFETWDEQVKEFTNIAREVTRKRSEKFIPIRINASHIKTKERIDYINSFRKRHQELRNTLSKVLGSGRSTESSLSIGLEGVDPIKEIKEAYDIIKTSTVLTHPKTVFTAGTRLKRSTTNGLPVLKMPSLPCFAIV